MLTSATVFMVCPPWVFADLEAAIAALPEPKLTRDQRDVADLVNLRAARDSAYQRGYSATGAKLDSAVAVVEQHQTAQRHRRTADAILAGASSKPAAPRHRHPEAAADALAVIALHAANETVAEIREGRRRLAVPDRRISVNDAPVTGRRYTMADAPRILPDGATLKV